MSSDAFNLKRALCLSSLLPKEFVHHPCNQSIGCESRASSASEPACLVGRFS